MQWLSNGRRAPVHGRGALSRHLPLDGRDDLRVPLIEGENDA